MNTFFWVGVAVGAALGLSLGWWAERQRVRRFAREAEESAQQIRRAAEEDAERIRKTAELEGREAAYEAKDEWGREEARRREELEHGEARLERRRGSLDGKYDLLDEKERLLEEREQRVQARSDEIERQSREHDRLHEQARRRLEAVAGLSAEEAKRELEEQIEAEARADAASRVREIKEEAEREAEHEATEIVASAIQRIAAGHTAENTVSVVDLPSDEMKGRIIGREGRNIRAFEQATGVDVIIDDTPEMVMLSSFDPVRREKARISLEALVEDGRIHPGRIEEVVGEGDEKLERALVEHAEEVLYDLDVHGVHPEIVKVLGRLKFRTSYGQNQLLHAKEVALLAGNMAAEMQLDIAMSKRMGLLHDVGKGLTHEHEGTHVELGHRLCKEYDESDAVLNAIRAHHEEEPHRYAEAFLVSAADAISGARPGARREMFDTYVNRLENLEQIGQSFPGVERCFVIQAGREVRVMVDPDQIDDAAMSELSERISTRFENELQYPGQVKVVIIREQRAVDFAR